MTNKTTTRPSLGRIALIAGAVGIVAGLAAVYGIGGLPGNGADAGKCGLAAATAREIRPLKVGHMKTFIPAEQPVQVADLAFNDADGTARTIADYKDKVVLLNLWATWCVPCRKEMPALDRLQQKLGSDDFTVLAVNIDRRKVERAKAFMETNNIGNLGFNTDPTTKIFETLKMRGRAIGMPTTMLINGDGCEIGTLHGAAEWDSDDAVRLIEAAVQARK